MSIKFAATSSQPTASNGYIDWGDLAAVQSLTKMSISAWILPTSDNAWAGSTGQEFVCKFVSSPTPTGWLLARVIGGVSPTKNLVFSAVGWTTNFGQWVSANNTLLANTKYHVVVTYDASSTANNPIFYINGSVSAVTRNATPAGTWRTNSGTHLTAGLIETENTGASAMPGNVEDIRIYNRILSAAEVSILRGGGSPSRSVLESLDSGLVFHAPLLYATAMGSALPFSGTLTGSNLFYDRIAGAVGTPTASLVYPSADADIVYGTAF